MKQFLIFATLFLINKTATSQEVKTDSILTEKQNTEWIVGFEKLGSKSDQIVEIKSKIFSDSVYVKQVRLNTTGYPITIRYGNLNKANCECKIVFIYEF